MHLKCLACESLARAVYYCAALSPHVVDVALNPLGWHRDPDDLRARLQAQIDAAAEGYDAVVLAYGLCGKATAGLRAIGVPLVLPRAHDCITLFLGARERYAAEFEQHPGTYWYALDYVQRNDDAGVALSLGSGLDVDLDAVYDDYVAKYGQDNADYLMTVMSAWQEHYSRAAFVDLGLGESNALRSQVQAEAQQRGWTFAELAGDLVLVRRLLEGDWNEDFLVVPPGRRVEMAHSGDVVKWK